MTQEHSAEKDALAERDVSCYERRLASCPHWVGRGEPCEPPCTSPGETR